MPHVILFYKYAPLSSDPEIMKIYQKAMHDLCAGLSLTGRVLIGMSDDAEGINGTLAGDDKKNVLAYTYAMLGRDWCMDPSNDTDGVVLSDTDSDADADADADSDGNSGNTYNSLIRKFWKEQETFFEAAKAPVLTMDSPVDFKWSSVDSDPKDEGLFPDLQIKLVKEIIGTGGVLSSISIQDTSKGYLTPQEWHEEIKKLKDPSNSSSNNAKDTVLIDCRNHKEFEIGHFDNAVDPNTKTFEQFPRWVQENKSALKNKKILMYCTGGIRCEKASAYVRRELDNKSTVQHLQGGIHKYLDKFGGDGFFQGSNFVFDRRVGVDADDHVKGKKDHDTSKNTSVGKCLYCDKNYDKFTADAVCTVCREMTLVCEDCKSGLHGEYHCSDHQHLRTCYFTNLTRFNREELAAQLQGLETLLAEIAVGKRYRQKRRTLQRQIGRVTEALRDLKCCGKERRETVTICRSCGDASCNGECWGVHGLKRKHVLESSVDRPKKSMRVSANKRSQKVLQKEKDLLEMKQFGLSQPPSAHRCSKTSIRCPPPFVRELSSSVKGKWVGKSVQSVLQSEFHELSDSERLDTLFKKSLIRLNGIPVNSEAALVRGVDATKAVSQDTPLKNMDVISRFTYWHEPPVLVPDKITVNKLSLPKTVANEYMSSTKDDVSKDDVSIYCCDKPSTVPVHPTGPYLQNSLTIMAEAQEGLEPRSLLPCHRLDRCTSGLTLCCTNPAVARIIQVQLDNKMVQKTYLARVKGMFPSTEDEVKNALQKKILPEYTNCSIIEGHIYVDAPVAVDDVMKGLRKVSEDGKAAKSKFTFLGYDKDTDMSLVECSPLTGRQHQLRVHLQFIGFPIQNDLLYGGDETDSVTGEKMKANSIAALIESNQNVECAQKEGISEEIISSAKDVSLVCQGHPEKLFNPSQLLVSGHQIDLHAMTYQIAFGKKKQKKSSENDGKEILATVECKIDPPAWAKAFQK